MRGLFGPESARSRLTRDVSVLMPRPHRSQTRKRSLNDDVFDLFTHVRAPCCGRVAMGRGNRKPWTLREGRFFNHEKSLCGIQSSIMRKET